MADDLSLHARSVTKRVRQGAKSCTECRRRKIRCTWPHNTTLTSCNGCATHGRVCIPQATGVRKSASTRLSQLENEVSALRDQVKKQPNGEEISSTKANSTVQRDQSNLVELQPSHLRILFAESDDKAPASSKKLDVCAISNARQHLCPLIPSLEDVLTVWEYASPWMSLYYTLFPSSFGVRTGEQLCRMHENIQEANPLTIGHWLLSLVITIQQASITQFGGRNTATYTEAVENAVERSIVNDPILIGSAEGLEIAMLFIRLSMGIDNLQRTWLSLRKVIAVAEMMGLPTSHDLSKLLVWEGICATDRNFSMMLNLPPGTARYPFPLDDTILRSGRSLSSAYNYQLSKICAMIYEIDEAYSSSVSAAESFSKILSADRCLRELAKHPKGDDLASLLVEFWHHYITVRVHLRPTMSRSDEYAYSHEACIKACEHALRCFPGFRLSVPEGFFVCRILDLQIFTVASVLLLITATSVESSILISGVIQCLEDIVGRAGSDFATQAISALHILQNRHLSNDARSASIEVPLLGRIQLQNPTAEAAPRDVNSLSVTELPADDAAWSFIFDDEPWLTGLSMDIEGFSDQYNG